MQIHCSTHSDILTVTATQNTCSLNGSTAPTDQYSEVDNVHACSYQSTLLGCGLDVVQTLLIVLTVSGLFLDRPLVCVCVCVCVYI